jgi:hypothetical protein
MRERFERGLVVALFAFTTYWFLVCVDWIVRSLLDIAHRLML